MYISSRMAQVRNVSIATINDTVTLIVLLIAPLGLAAVIINTVLVMIATYLTGTVADRVVRYLGGGSARVELIDQTRPGTIRRQDSGDLDRP